jgi:hypothetical protein
MTLRLSTRHCAALAVGGGFITLAVVLLRISPVWLAVGPALLAALDAVVSSPVLGLPTAAAVGRLLGRPRVVRRLWPLRVYDYLPSRAAFVLVSVAVASVAVQFLPFWLGVLVIVGVVLVASALVGRLKPSRIPERLYVPPTGESAREAAHRLSPSIRVGGRLPAVPWLERQLAAAGDAPLAVAVYAYDDRMPAGLLADAVAFLASVRGVAVHYLSDDEFLLVGAPSAVHFAQGHRIEVLIRGEPRPPQPSIGEVVYPADGTDAAALIARARAKLKRRVR